MKQRYPSLTPKYQPRSIEQVKNELSKSKGYGLTRITYFDYTLGVSTQIAPYQCDGCKAIFKRLSGLSKHNRFQRSKGRCPNDLEIQSLQMRQTTHNANGNQYNCWELIPAVKPTGLKDELLLEKEKTAFPNMNYLQEQV